MISGVLTYGVADLLRLSLQKYEWDLKIYETRLVESGSFWIYPFEDPQFIQGASIQVTGTQKGLALDERQAQFQIIHEESKITWPTVKCFDINREEKTESEVSFTFSHFGRK